MLKRDPEKVLKRDGASGGRLSGWVVSACRERQGPAGVAVESCSVSDQVPVTQVR